jgi:hypothetical protein
VPNSAAIFREDHESSHHETEEEKHTRAKNELDVVGKYKSESGISVEDVLAVVDLKTLKNREIAHKFNAGWELGTVKGVEKSGEFAVFHESDSQLWKQDLNEQHYRVDK